MDYKYINQLLDRYWQGETSIEEENILRTFFSQEEIPAALLPFKALFVYQQSEVKSDVLGDEFDKKMMSLIPEESVVKAKHLSMAVRLRPLFKAAAVVAIILTLGNAMQVPFSERQSDPISQYNGYTKPDILRGKSVAMSDSIKSDSLKHSMIQMDDDAASVTIK